MISLFKQRTLALSHFRKNIMTITEKQQVKDFIQSNDDFRIVYSSSKHILPSTDHLIIVDSSFNPPHKAHLALAEAALLNSNSKTSSTIVMLLSVKNADKVKPVEAMFDERLYMMQLLVSSFQSTTTGPHVVLALTNHAKFIDKAAALNRLYSTIKKFTFVMGFDTLTRFFDLKYYPKTPQDSNPLNSMIKTFFGPLNSDIHCVIRTSQQWGTKDDQEKYVNDIKYRLNLPTNSIILSNAILPSLSNPQQPATETHDGIAISSSAIRKFIHLGDSDKAKEMLTKPVFDYINENQLYKDGN